MSILSSYFLLPTSTLISKPILKPMTPPAQKNTPKNTPIRRVMKSSPSMFVKSAQKPRASFDASRIIEGLLYEIIPSLTKSKAKRVARQLASLRAFQSIDSSTGKKCLKLRLKKVSQKLLDIAKQRQASKLIDDVEEVSQNVRRISLDPRHILMNTVGEAKYEEILSVSQEIKEIRQYSAVWTKFSRPPSFEVEEGAPASEILPTPIVDIYFRTRLMDIMCAVNTKSCTSHNKVRERFTCIAQRSDWDLLLEDAKVKLAAFRMFEMENFVEGKKLTFQCKSGLCLLSTVATGRTVGLSKTGPNN